MFRVLPDSELAKRIGFLSWSTGLQFFSLMILYAAVAETTGAEIQFRQAPSSGIGILLGIVLLGDWLVNAYAFPSLVQRLERIRLGIFVLSFFLLFSLLGRIIAIFSLLINAIQIKLEFIWLYWTAPLGSIFFSILIFMLSKSTIAYSRGNRLRILAGINFTVSLVMLAAAIANYYIKPLDFDLWNIIVLIYSYKVGIMAIAFALEYDSWSTEIEKVSQILEEE